MSAQTSLVLNDGQATPVAKTFSARGADLGTAVWKDISGGISIGMPTIIMKYGESDGTNGAYRTDLRVMIPVLEVISGSDGGYTPAPKIAYKMYGRLELVSPNRATLQNRKDLVAFCKNLLAHAVVTETLVDFNPPN